MAGYKKKSRAGTVIATIAAILILALVVGLIYKLTNGFNSDPKTFAVEHNGKLIVNDETGVSVSSGDTFTIKRLTNKSQDYDIKIYAAGTEETDFTFTIGAEEYSWYGDLVKPKVELTGGFTIKKDGDSFNITGGLRSALENYAAGLGIGMPETIPAGDRFRMEITVGKSVMKIGFTIAAKVTGVTLPGNLIVG